MLNTQTNYGSNQNIRHPTTRLGYIDARTAKPFRPEYESWPDDAQKNYELGRLWAINLRSAGLPLPDWPTRSALRWPNEIYRLLTHCVVLTGSPLPRDPQAPREFKPARLVSPDELGL